MASPGEVLKAFDLGGGKGSEDNAVISNPQTYKMDSTYEEGPEAHYPGTACASKAQETIHAMPGQTWGQSGTTLYNPLPSDPRVEAILGERHYRAKPQEDSPDAMRIKLKEMEAKLAQFTDLLAERVDIQAGPVDEAAPADTEIPDTGSPAPRRRRR